MNTFSFVRTTLAYTATIAAMIATPTLVTAALVVR